MNIIQIGDGNFIRGFIDYMYQKTSLDKEIKIYSLQSRPTGKGAALLKKQNNRFHVLETGFIKGRKHQKIYLIDTIKRAIDPYKEWEQLKNEILTKPIHAIYSNTTEAGITNFNEPFQMEKACLGYPAKLIQILYLQYKNLFTHTIYVLPLELIQRNGEFLKKICIEIINEWELEKEFVDWVNNYVIFLNTLVDRIVSGYPKEVNINSFDLPFEDHLFTQVEPYYMFAIEGPPELDQYLHLKKRNENIIYTDNLNKISKLKIELLNGVHTILANIGKWYETETVRDGMNHPKIKNFIEFIACEGIIKTSKDYSVEEGLHFYKQVIERFNNPYIKHYLKDIRLNNVSKVMSRVNPIFLRNILFNNEDVLKKLLSFYICSYCNDTNTDVAEITFDKLVGLYWEKERDKIFQNENILPLFHRLKEEMQSENDNM